MAEHKFGGSWTESKLALLRKYLQAYRTIFTQNQKARYFETWYVDAFAGTGSRLVSVAAAEPSLFQDVYDDEVTTGYQDGSAKIALGLPEPFDNYLFIDKVQDHVSELRGTIERDYPQLLSRCDFKRGDANDVLKTWCRSRNWANERAVVFLDP